MTKETNSRSYTSFAELAKAIGTTPAELRKQYLDKAIADTMHGEQEAGTTATPDELAALARQAEIADMIAQDSVLDSFTEAFGDVTALSILDMGGEAQELDMPEPAEAQAECHAIINTIFDLFRDTRLEPSAQAIAWGIVNSFHYEAEKLAREEDTLCRDLKDRIEQDDRSEIYATEMEDLQVRAQTKMEQRAAIECMRDYAANCYRSQTGRPWSTARGSRVSSVTTASQIASADFLKARATAMREKRNPTGPLVVFSGGQEWHDYQQLYARLDQIKARIPSMTLCTTGQRKGCDAIAAAWAAQAGVPIVTFAPNAQRFGKSAGFKRNDQLVSLRPVEAIICQGTGIQSHLLDELKDAGVPTHAFRYDAQAPMTADTKRQNWG
jgi:hypothetical protein